MKLNISIFLAVLLLSLINVHANSFSDFKITNLSKDGRQAYNTLLNARFFGMGFVGWIAQQSPNELALRTLLNEKPAAKALKSLIRKATPEGSLYGLFGLRMLDIKIFNRELKEYKSKPEPPERNRYSNTKISSGLIPDKFSKVPAGKIIVVEGCMSTFRLRQKVISSIESGEYDKEFRLNETGIPYIIQDDTVIHSN